MTTIRQLQEMQELDLEIDRLTSQVATIQKRLQEDPAIASARQALAHRRGLVQQMRREQERRTLEVTELKEKAKGLEERLYGGSVRNVKEMEALQSELKGVQEQVRRIEDDEVLALMVGIEEHEAWIVQAVAALAEQEQQRATLVEQLTTERGHLEGVLPGRKARRQEMALGVAPALMAQYERLRGQLQGRALARVERDMCTACRLTLPTREMQRVRTAREPVLCPNCGRMLYAG